MRRTAQGVKISIPTVVTVSGCQNVQTRWGIVNGDFVANLTDAILAIKVISGMTHAGQNILISADVNSNGKIGLEEVIYILQNVAGVR